MAMKKPAINKPAAAELRQPGQHAHARFKQSDAGLFGDIGKDRVRPGEFLHPHKCHEGGDKAGSNRKI
jgi:hypothetical protein